jgi:hypothetical protein
MHTLTRDVRELNESDRQAIEHLLGEPLRDDQRLLIQVVDPVTTEDAATSLSALPSWCNVYEGLTDEEIADLEQTILKRTDPDRGVQSSSSIATVPSASPCR